MILLCVKKRRKGLSKIQLEDPSAMRLPVPTNDRNQCDTLSCLALRYDDIPLISSYRYRSIPVMECQFQVFNSVSCLYLEVALQQQRMNSNERYRIHILKCLHFITFEYFMLPPPTLTVRYTQHKVGQASSSLSRPHSFALCSFKNCTSSWRRSA